jgi:hypothetical protein
MLNTTSDTKISRSNGGVTYKNVVRIETEFISLAQNHNKLQSPKISFSKSFVLVLVLALEFLWDQLT